MINRFSSLSRALLAPATAAVMAICVFSSVAVRADQLEKVLERGSIEAAAYREFPPFSFRKDGKRAGIDVDIAELVAKKIGVNLSVRMIGVDENMEDDLRNNIWKGHYIGGGVADFMMHVPYDLEFAKENDLVSFIAPYYRETLALAVNPDTASSLRSVEDIDQHLIGVEVDTLADFYLLSPRHGNKQANVVHFVNISEAAVAFANGDIDAIFGPSVEVQGILGETQATFDLRSMPVSGLRSNGWDVGVALRFNHKELIQAVTNAMAELRDEGAIEAIFERYGVDYTDPLPASIATGYKLQ